MYLQFVRVFIANMCCPSAVAKNNLNEKGKKSELEGTYRQPSMHLDMYFPCSTGYEGSKRRRSGKWTRKYGKRGNRWSILWPWREFIQTKF